MTSSSKQNRHKIQSTEKQSASFLKEYVENADLCETVMNKIMAMHKKCIKNTIC